MSKIIIIGVPRAGKTSYANRHFSKNLIMHSDDLLDIEYMAWPQRSEKIAEWIEENESFCIEGCDTVRGLRKYMKLHPGKLPAHTVVWMGKPKEPLTEGQERFGKACNTVFQEILPDLYKLGVEVVLYDS